MINLNTILKPNIIEPLDFEAILIEMMLDFVGRNPDFDAVLESDPAIKVLEACAYRELILRARINHACNALMLSFASDRDLDQLAANVNLERLLIDAGDPESSPSKLPVYESDTELKRRVLLQFEKITGAGPQLSYVAHALSADGNVKDAHASNINKQNQIVPGSVFISVLTRDNLITQALLDKVYAACNAENVRPLCDTVISQSADIIDFQINIALILYKKSDFEQEKAKVIDRLNVYCEAEFMLGREITKAAIDAVTKSAIGVHDVIINDPAQNVTCQKWQAPRCINISVDFGGYYV